MALQGVDLSGNERAEYFASLQRNLRVLATSLAEEKNSYQEAQLAEFGRQKGWNLDRLPPVDFTYKILSKLIKGVCEQYSWLSDVVDKENSECNRGYFDKSMISVESGLPWVFDFVELHRVNREAPTLLANLPSYDNMVKRAVAVLSGDTFSIDESRTRAFEMHRSAMKRSFLEQIASAELYPWEGVSGGIFYAQKIIPLGAETLWNVHGVRYLPNAHMFEAYVVDAWQDSSAPAVIKENGANTSGIVAPELIKEFNFSIDNAPWFVLRNIDEKFRNLHPVHVSRALIGPFENKHMTNHLIPVVADVIKEEPDCSVLRFSRQYSYAPNHKVEGSVLRQEIYRETWADEIIVAPSKHSSRIAKGVEGTNVRVIEIKEDIK